MELDAMRAKLREMAVAATDSDDSEFLLAVSSDLEATNTTARVSTEGWEASRKLANLSKSLRALLAEARDSVCSLQCRRCFPPGGGHSDQCRAIGAALAEPCGPTQTHGGAQ
jgi:hypothetical protein